MIDVHWLILFETAKLIIFRIIGKNIVINVVNINNINHAKGTGREIDTWLHEIPCNFVISKQTIYETIGFPHIYAQ